jgi:hypothetical protein
MRSTTVLAMAARTSGSVSRITPQRDNNRGASEGLICLDGLILITLTVI